MIKSLLTLGLLAVLVMVFSLPAFAGEMEYNFGIYLKTLSDQDFASAIVYLKDRPNIRSLDQTLHANRTPLAVRHETVINALKEAAGRSQPSLLNYLDGRIKAGVVEGYTSYWIMNLVVVSATKNELYKIAQRPEVEAIEGNFKPVLVKPVEGPTTTFPTAGIGVTNSLRAINADMVWYNLGITGFGRLVGDLDTGADGDHPALTARWRGNWHPWQECWRDALGFGVPGGTTYPVDNDGHGTFTMGIMCGLDPTTSDTIGVAWESQWIADNSIDQLISGELDNDILGAFQWFADPDGDPATIDDVPDVVNSSWGVNATYSGYQDCDYRWQEVIENCEAAGVVCIFAAGNEGPDAMTIRSPANICNTATVNFSVGAVDAENCLWPYPIFASSSRGPSDCDGISIKPEVCAPGAFVYSSYIDGSYTQSSGTSAAAPHVSGVIALMRQADPNADVQTIKEMLMLMAHDLGSVGEDNDYGWGVIDAYAAVRAIIDSTPPEVHVTVPNGGEVLYRGNVCTITWSATDDVGIIMATSVYYSHDGGASYCLIDSLQGNPGSYDWVVSDTISTECLVKVYAYDQLGNQGWDISDNFFTIQQDPEAPVVTVLQPNGGEVLYRGSVYTIIWNATDKGKIAATSIYYTSDGGTSYNLIDSLSGNPGSYDWIVSSTISSQCLIKIYAYDQEGKQGLDASDNFFSVVFLSMPYFWVKNIDLSITVIRTSVYAGASVTIWDQDNNPVGNAEVHSHWSGITSDSDVFSTNSQGVGTCISDKLKNLQHWPIGWWYFYVDDVIKSGYYFKSDIGEAVDSIFQDQVPKLAESTIKEFSVSQNYPNPFNPVTQFSIDLPVETQVRFDIYNVAGQKVRTLVEAPLPAGSHRISWDSTNEKGEAVSAGVYFYRVVCGENVVKSKMLLLK